MEIGGIPFYIGNRDRADHLDVGLAKWPQVNGNRWDELHYVPRGLDDPQVPVVRLPQQYYSAALPPEVRRS